MTLRNTREHGVRAVNATCEKCHHEAVVNVDSMLDDVYVPDVALCGAQAESAMTLMVSPNASNLTPSAWKSIVTSSPS